MAAFDALTGKPTDWAPEIRSYVYALAMWGETIFAGGGFTSAGGQARRGLAAIDVATGQFRDWNLSVNGTVHCLYAADNRIYVGGIFTTFAGQPRNCLAAIDAITGQLIDWNPGANASVSALLVSDGIVYAGGDFTFVGGMPRNSLAAIRGDTGQVTNWDPNAQNGVRALAMADGVLYAGGSFFFVGNEQHIGLVAIDVQTGAPLAWDPAINGLVRTIAVKEDALYVGGDFDNVNDLTRPGLAALDRNTGEVRDWAPGNSTLNSVYSLALTEQALYAGGFTIMVSTSPRSYAFVNFQLTGAPRLTPPADRIVFEGEGVTLNVAAQGQEPFSYQWRFNGTNLPGATNASLVFSNIQVVHSGIYFVIVTNALGAFTAEANVTVLVPVKIVGQPLSRTVEPGSTLTLSVQATGNPPPTYQWRLNGANIPGAVFSTLTLSNAQPAAGGSYNVVAANRVNAVSSDIATVVVISPALPFADNFSARGLITSPSGLGSGNNAGATREAGEPEHADKAGGKSVWLSWRAPATGVASFSTRGSSFDTLLAVYSGTNVANLTEVASDEDRAGFATSEVSFNAEPGADYAIAIDGLVGGSGNIVLSWSLDTTNMPFPRITLQPTSTTVTPGATVIFEVNAITNSPLRWQWFHGCRLLAGQTNRFLTISNVNLFNVGGYRCVVRNNSTHPAESAEALLEIGPVSDIVSQDKLEDIIAALARPPSFTVAAALSSPTINVAMGSITSPQLFNTTGSGTSGGESNHCGVLGGASKWFSVHPEASGTMIIDTIGSSTSIDTVLAVYTGPGAFRLMQVACDDNSADGRNSVVRFEATHTTNYWVVVDGVNGTAGEVQLNWKVGRAPIIVMTLRPRTPRLGGTLELCVEVSNAIPPPTIQWLFNGQPIANATNLTLRLTNVQLANAGVYSVVVQNFVSAVTNSFGRIEVATPISVTPTLITSNGATYLRINVPPAKQYVVEGAGGLHDPWLALYTNRADSAVAIQVLDPAPATNAWRYYRVVPSP